MQTIITLTICAIIVQFLTEQTKKLFSAINRSEMAPLIALAYGILISFATHNGIFAALGIYLHPPIIDWVITGIAYSGGAVAFNELIKLVSELRPSNQVK